MLCVPCKIRMSRFLLWKGGIKYQWGCWSDNIKHKTKCDDHKNYSIDYVITILVGYMYVTHEMNVLTCVIKDHVPQCLPYDCCFLSRFSWLLCRNYLFEGKRLSDWWPIMRLYLSSWLPAEIWSESGTLIANTVVQWNSSLHNTSRHRQKTECRQEPRKKILEIECQFLYPSYGYKTWFF